MTNESAFRNSRVNDAKHVVAAKIKHETNGFNTVLTTLQDFRDAEFYCGDEALAHYAGTRLEMGAFIACAERFGWRLRVPVATFANPSGVVAEAAFETVTGLLIAELQQAKQIDGVLLALHGSMFTEQHMDAEGELLKRVRRVIGSDVPIAVTLDPHANVTEEMIKHSDILTAFRTSPHTDQFETGMRAAQLLNETMSGRLKPRLVMSRRPLLQGFDGARTYVSGGPMVHALSVAAEAETVPGIACVSVHAGFSRCDVPEMGPTVVVTTDGDVPKGREVAESLMDFCWSTKAVWSDPLHTIEQAVAAARKHAGAPPLVLGDYGDAPGGGSYGDSTRLLRALLDAGVSNGAFGAIFDPGAASAAIAAGVGAALRVRLGGHSDIATMGSPIDCEAQVLAISTTGDVVYTGPYGTGTKRSFGPSACLRIGGFDVIVSSLNLGIYDLEQFRIFGIEPTAKSVIVVKCMQGHHAAFDPIAARVMDVDTGGLTSADLSRFSFRHVRRPSWPLDEVAL